MKPSLHQLVSWVKESGKIMIAGFDNAKILKKGDIDSVTEIDYKIEDFLIKEINNQFPKDGIITEEHGVIPGENNHSWYIDPIDGTTNYIHGVPFFSCSLAYCESNEILLASVYNPISDECYAAERGVGAWLNEVKINTSKISSLSDSLLVTGFPYELLNSENNNLMNYGCLINSTQGVHRLGSAALNLCYVASGRFDGYWELQTSPWDIAAGALIAREAGAIVTDVYGSSYFFHPPYSILAANAQLHKILLEIISKTEKMK